MQLVFAQQLFEFAQFFGQQEIIVAAMSASLCALIA